MIKSNVKYQVIYSIDIPRSENETLISDCKTDLLRKTSIFEVTETDPDDFDVKYHRKYRGLLTASQTEKFLDEIEAHSTCETMGSLDLNFGWLPAISFETDNSHYGYWDCCYISPVVLDDSPDDFDPKNNKQDALILQNEIHPKLDTLIDNLRKILDYDPDSPGDAEISLVSEIYFDLDQMHLEF